MFHFPRGPTYEKLEFRDTHTSDLLGEMVTSTSLDSTVTHLDLGFHLATVTLATSIHLPV